MQHVEAILKRFPIGRIIHNVQSVKLKSKLVRVAEQFIAQFVKLGYEIQPDLLLCLHAINVELANILAEAAPKIKEC